MTFGEVLGLAIVLVIVGWTLWRQVRARGCDGGGGGCSGCSVNAGCSAVAKMSPISRQHEVVRNESKLAPAQPQG